MVVLEVDGRLWTGSMRLCEGLVKDDSWKWSDGEV